MLLWWLIEEDGAPRKKRLVLNAVPRPALFPRKWGVNIETEPRSGQRQTLFGRTEAGPLRFGALCACDGMQLDSQNPMRGAT